MTYSRLERDHVSAPFGKFSISETGLFAAILLIDLAVATALGLSTIISVLSSDASEARLHGMLGVSLEAGITVACINAIPKSFLTRSRLFQVRRFFSIFVYTVLTLAIAIQFAPSLAAPVIIFAAMTTVILLSNHLICIYLLDTFEKKGVIARRSAVIMVVGSEDRLHRQLRLIRNRYRVLGEFSLSKDQPVEILRDGLGFIVSSGAQELFIIETDDRASYATLETLAASPVATYILPSVALGRFIELHRRNSVGTTTVFELRRAALNTIEQRVKRLIDIIFAMFGLILTAPVLLLIAVLVKLDTPGPIIFRQSRLGLLGRPFRIMKFRSMHVWQDSSNVVQASRGDARITRLGRWLRSTSLDELPQLMNVLKGDMSIVGPRPHAVAHDIYFSERLQNYSLRQRVRPGLTGWAQVNFHRGETPTLDKMKQRVDLDLWYIKYWTPALDFAIILRTAVHVFRARDAH